MNISLLQLTDLLTKKKKKRRYAPAIQIPVRALVNRHVPVIWIDRSGSSPSWGSFSGNANVSVNSTNGESKKNDPIRIQSTTATLTALESTQTDRESLYRET